LIDLMEKNCIEALANGGVLLKNIVRARVSGSFELPHVSTFPTAASFRTFQNVPTDSFTTFQLLPPILSQCSNLSNLLLPYFSSHALNT
jgi:hypothetical protein